MLKSVTFLKICKDVEKVNIIKQNTTLESNISWEYNLIAFKINMYLYFFFS